MIFLEHETEIKKPGENKFEWASRITVSPLILPGIVLLRTNSAGISPLSKAEILSDLCKV